MDQNPWANSGRFDVPAGQQTSSHNQNQTQGNTNNYQSYTQNYNQIYNHN